MFGFRIRPLLALGAVAAALVLVVTAADARSRTSGGSRGSQTYSAPPSTNTAPTVRPMERSMTQPGQSGSLAQRPAPAPTPAPGGLFGRPGFMGGLFAGFLGAGLLGMLFGHGIGGGLGGFASVLGLMLQIGIVVLIGYLLWMWWQRRSQPALANGPAMRNMTPEGSRPSFGLGGLGGGLAGLGGGGSGSAPVARAAGTDEVGTTPEDFNTFERLLGEIQTAYGAEDLAALRARVTPEMLSYFSEELSGNASSGVVNRISDVKLQQGDLAEAWREGDVDYATVALRYSLVDQVVDRASGRVVQGGPDEATEVWTFMRRRGGQWILSAIQQTA
jgi:predicted lipid-binding transport protein (Tim44 family)